MNRKQRLLEKLAGKIDPETLKILQDIFSDKMDTVLFYCPQMEDLARKIAAKDDGITLGEIDWDKFEDGMPNEFVRHVGTQVKGQNVAFLSSFDTVGDIFVQLAAFTALPRYLARSFRLLLPDFPTGTMERVNKLGEVATAKTLARVLSTIPSARAGKAEIVIYDIHALGTWFYFGDEVNTQFESGIPLIRSVLDKMDNIAICFPDDGAYKRYKDRFDGFPKIVCLKIRGEGDKRLITIKEGGPKGKHCVIIDDRIQTGGTILKCKDTLFSAGAAQVSAYATHGVFPEESWKKFVNAGFEKVWITDSRPFTVKAVFGVEPFEILSLAPELAKLITTELS